MTVGYLLGALREGLDGYRAQQADGADMAQAGAELFTYLRTVTSPRPCSPNRYSTLGLIVRNNDPDDLQDIRQLVVETAGPGQDVRKILDLIDERIALLRQTEPVDDLNLDTPDLSPGAIPIDELP